MPIRAIIPALLLAFTLPAAAQTVNPAEYAPASENPAQPIKPVKLSILVSPEGKAVEVSILESSGYEGLDETAVATAKKDKYDAAGYWVRYSGLNLNQYGIASPCRTICNVCGFVALS